MQTVDIGGPCAVCCVRADDAAPCIEGIHRRSVDEAPRRITFAVDYSHLEFFGWPDGTVFVLDFDAPSRILEFAMFLEPDEDIPADVCYPEALADRVRAAVAEVRG